MDYLIMSTTNQYSIFYGFPIGIQLEIVTAKWSSKTNYGIMAQPKNLSSLKIVHAPRISCKANDHIIVWRHSPINIA